MEEDSHPLRMIDLPSGDQGAPSASNRKSDLTCAPAAVVRATLFHAIGLSAVMIDFECETPFVHWTSDAFNLKGSHQNVERAVWHHSPSLSYTIADSCVTFDAPPEWGDGLSPVRLQRTLGGNYECFSQSTCFKSVRADTLEHTLS